METLEKRGEHLAAALFDSLQAFDKANAPFGLYSLDATFKRRGFNFTGETSKRVLWPALYHLGCEATYNDSNLWKYNYHCINFVTPQNDFGTLFLERVSFIKVSQFGNAYHVDKSIDHQQRWEEIDIKSRIKQLARLDSVTSEVQMQLVMLVGFDKEPLPLGVEIRRLQQELGSLSDQLSFFDRVWPDASGRGFTIRACIWAKLQTQHDTRS